jgi:tRNA-specific 2-thiouridylase
MSKIIVGMSGGIDSSVTAYLLKKQGHEVEGLSFILRGETAPATRCSLQSIEEASKTARHIGIPHSAIDVRDDFIKKVIEPFVDAYISGSTPNPCVLCNRFIKFPFLLKEAEKRGAEYISTGHHARVEKSQKSEVTCHKSIISNNPSIPPLEKGSEGGFEKGYTDCFLLKKGFDFKKDQSYVLYVLTQNELKRLILPLGNYKKEEVRKIAEELDLPVKRSESQDICFIEDRNYFKFIEKLSSVAGKPGPIIHMNGRIIGTHKGIHGYTIGQRKGLGISSPEPLYVLKIDALKNIIYAGPCKAAKKRDFFVEDLNWILPIWGEGEAVHRPYRASVKVRSMMKDEPATVFLIPPPTRGGGNREIVRVIFDKPQWAPAPGQSAVFYDGDTVIGGGTIKIPA